MTSILNVSVMPHLNETNYLTWNIRMCTLLICADLWGIVSGKEAAPNPATASTTTVDTFTLCQLKAAAKIALYVDDSQIIRVQGDDPKTIWDTLTSVHCAHGLSTQLAAMRKFSHMEKRLEQSITSWVGDVKAQAHLMKDIRIELPDLLTIVILTSSLPCEYDSVLLLSMLSNLMNLPLNLLSLNYSMKRSTTSVANSLMITKRCLSRANPTVPMPLLPFILGPISLASSVGKRAIMLRIVSRRKSMLILSKRYLMLHGNFQTFRGCIYYFHHFVYHLLFTWTCL